MSPHVCGPDIWHVLNAVTMRGGSLEINRPQVPPIYEAPPDDGHLWCATARFRVWRMARETHEEVFVPVEVSGFGESVAEAVTEVYGLIQGETRSQGCLL